MKGHRRPQREFTSQWVTGICSTGKRSRLTKISAKQHAKNMPGERMREYRCEECDSWHVGHLPRAVVQGQVTASEYYRPLAVL